MKTTLFSKSQALYSCTAIEDLINRYVDAGGQFLTVEEGCLGYGLTILYSPENALKTFVIREVPVTSWTSAHTVRAYNKIPAKYAAMIENA